MVVIAVYATDIVNESLIYRVLFSDSIMQIKKIHKPNQQNETCYSLRYFYHVWEQRLLELREKCTSVKREI